MKQSFSRPRLPGSARMRARGLVRAATAVAILAAVPVLLVYLFRQEASVRFNGVVESGAESVGPVEAARIVSIEVVEGQRVRAGDVLVRFDSADRLLDDSINEVKLREYEQNLVRRRETLADNERACRQLVRETEVKLEECRMDRVRDEARDLQLEALARSVSVNRVDDYLPRAEVGGALRPFDGVHPRELAAAPRRYLVA